MKKVAGKKTKKKKEKIRVKHLTEGEYYLNILYKTVTSCLFISKEALAQDTLNVSPQDVAICILKKIDYEVSLTDNQSNQVYALLLERSEKFDEARAHKYTASKNASYNEANGQALNKLKKVLTREQYDKFTLLRQEGKKQKEKYPGNGNKKSDQDIELDF